MAAEARALGEVRQTDEEDHHQKRCERQPERLEAVLRERRALGAGSRLLGVVADGDRAEARNRDAGELDDRHRHAGREAGSSLAHDAEERD
jgi:hypothetical protein